MIFSKSGGPQMTTSWSLAGGNTRYFLIVSSSTYPTPCPHTRTQTASPDVMTMRPPVSWRPSP
jgi:hypothetical protein